MAHAPVHMEIDDGLGFGGQRGGFGHQRIAFRTLHDPGEGGQAEAAAGTC